MKTIAVLRRVSPCTTIYELTDNNFSPCQSIRVEQKIYVLSYRRAENLPNIKLVILLLCRTLISQTTLVYQKIYSRHISCSYFNSLYLKLLISKSKLSGTRKVTLKYKLFEMNIYFEISRVDCISEENYFSHFNIKITSQSLERTPPLPPIFQRERLFKYKIYTNAFSICKQNIVLPSIQLIIHSLKHIDHLGELAK